MLSGEIAWTQNAVSHTAGHDSRAIARKLVRQCAGIREGDKVLLIGGPRDLQMLEDLAVETRKLGAFPLIQLQTENLERRTFEEVPPKYDSQTPELDLKVTGIIDALISIDPGFSDAALAHVPVSRRAARQKANLAVNK